MTEKWLKISWAPDYRISTLGNIKYKTSRFVDIQKDPEGYLRCTINGRRERIHRLVLEAFKPEREPGKNYVNHIDGNKANNNINNLEWVNAKENTQHAADFGAFKEAPNPQPIVGIHIDGDMESMIFSSQADAAEYIGACLDGSEINKVLHGKRYTTHGWIFGIIKDEDVVKIKIVASILKNKEEH